jgi:hypothetical protein
MVGEGRRLNMPVFAKESLEDIRNRLIQDCSKEPEQQRSGYVNGILDFYNAAKKQEKERTNECDQTAE